MYFVWNKLFEVLNIGEKTEIFWFLSPGGWHVFTDILWALNFFDSPITIHQFLRRKPQEV